MDDEQASGLVVALAALAGRPIDPAEVAAVLEQSRTMTAGRANDVWARHRRSPATVPLRDYLAMTLRFVEQSPG